MSEGFDFVTVDDVHREYNERAGAFNANLIDELECEKLHPRVWYLSPGDEMSYHEHNEQEEFYYVIRGSGRIRIDDEYYDVPEGTAIRISPEVPRQLVNDTNDQKHVWLVIGAPALSKDATHL